MTPEQADSNAKWAAFILLAVIAVGGYVMVGEINALKSRLAELERVCAPQRQEGIGG